MSILGTGLNNPKKILVLTDQAAIIEGIPAYCPAPPAPQTTTTTHEAARPL